MYPLPGTVTLVAICGFIVIWILRTIRAKATYYVAMSKNRCKEPVQYRHKDPILGLDLFLAYKNAFEKGKFLEISQRQFELYGKTFKAKSFGTTMIKTIDPEVSKAVHGTFFDNFGLQPLRYDTAKNLFGNGIIVVDGPAWAHARSMIRSSFEIVHIANFDFLSQHVDRFMELIPQDGSTVDLLPLFKRLILDTTSEFIFGESIDSLSSSTQIKSQEFLDSFQYAQRGVGLRAMLGKLKVLHRDKAWWSACRTVTDFCDQRVEKALARQRLRQETEKPDGSRELGYFQDKSEKLRLVDEMANKTQDPLDLRSQILAVFSPAHDGAAITLGNLFFHLARRPNIWKKLRAEILPTKEAPLTYELLKSYRYLDHVLRETHRLTPIATMNQRICLSDTVLPAGGGPDGKSPLFVQKGDIIEINYRAMQRNKDLWGTDAEGFNPDRWGTARPTWKYTPFGGGPRICPGQRLVYTESAYVAVRILRRYAVLENRDPEMEWKEEMRLTFQSKNGTKVALLLA